MDQVEEYTPWASNVVSLAGYIKEKLAEVLMYPHFLLEDALTNSIEIP